MKGRKPIDKIDRVFRPACLRWSTSNKIDYTKTREREDQGSEAGEWFCIKPLTSIADRVIPMRRNCLIKPFM